eukprot:10331280-Heterocapsa_arctica.AAC.1
MSSSWIKVWKRLEVGVVENRAVVGVLYVSVTPVSSVMAHAMFSSSPSPISRAAPGLASARNLVRQSAF